MQKNSIKLLLLIQIISISFLSNAQDWTNLGVTYSNPSPYPLNYFLLLDLDGYNGDVSAKFEVLVLADDNYMYHSRYSIFASRHSGSPSGRLDGVTMNYISGKPGMLEVLVLQDKIWIKASQRWGSMQYRLITERGFGNWKTPLTKVTTRPENVVTASMYPFYYDFDANQLNQFIAYSKSGNVGIGTNPNSGYILSANGTIRAKEIKVETGWADFVFEDDYQLMKLSDLEEFINENGHLPESPTEKEVEENGVLLGEMNLKLLQKIEEQSLYIIQLNKKLIEVQKRLQELE
jgi:hypothetical protein